ncbi:MAG: DHH family phosphoesterase [Candidatus Micrarchaeales archaeon]
MKIGFNDLLNFLILNREKKFLITFHSMGDRDSVGSAIALQKYLLHSIISTPDFITGTSRRMMEAIPNTIKISNKFPKDIDGIIIVDANTPEATGSFAGKIKKFNKPVLFLDHHEPHKSDDTKATIFHDENYNSTSSLVYHILTNLGIKPDREASLALLNGIIADSFEFRNMHALTFRQIAELMHSGNISYAEFLEKFGEKVPAANRITAMRDFCGAQTDVVGDYLLVHGTASINASVAAETAIRMGADASVFWMIGKKEVSVSTRLKPPLEKKLSIHLGRMMQEVAPIISGSGGGHPAAAGLYGPGIKNAKKATDKIISDLKKKLQG